MPYFSQKDKEAFSILKMPEGHSAEDIERSLEWLSLTIFHTLNGPETLQDIGYELLEVANQLITRHNLHLKVGSDDNVGTQSAGG